MFNYFHIQLSNLHEITDFIWLSDDVNTRIRLT